MEIIIRASSNLEREKDKVSANIVMKMSMRDNGRTVSLMAKEHINGKAVRYIQVIGKII